MPTDDSGAPAEPDWHRAAVGGLWEEIGRLQLEFLVSQGLKPGHRVLDVGCGSLRGGIHLIRYLDPGGYVGVDKNPQLLAAGRDIELRRAGLEDRPTLLVGLDHFEFGTLNRRFDYAIAHSLFTHLPLNEILVCLMRIEPVLAADGKLYATFFENTRGKAFLDPIVWPGVDGDTVTFPDRDPYHYCFDAFEWICRGTGLRAECLGEWGHPRSQRMLRFTRRASGPDSRERPAGAGDPA